MWVLSAGYDIREDDAPEVQLSTQYGLLLVEIFDILVESKEYAYVRLDCKGHLRRGYTKRFGVTEYNYQRYNDVDTTELESVQAEFMFDNYASMECIVDEWAFENYHERGLLLDKSVVVDNVYEKVTEAISWFLASKRDANVLPDGRLYLGDIPTKLA